MWRFLRWFGPLILFVACIVLLVTLVICGKVYQKHRLEHIVGHNISWFDYFVTRD